jgi:D-alanyl-D-alanine endopeptidase (penicillin-binding protein 7)
MDAVINWLWQGAVVGAALSVMLVTLKRARANVRYVVCWAAALIVLVLPILRFLQPSGAVDAVSVQDSGAIVALPDAWWTSTRVMLGAAMVWAGINVFRLSSAIFAIRRARRRSRTFPVRLESLLPHWRRIRGEGRRATLVLSNSVTSAAVLGWGAPMIAVAPSLVRTLDPEDLDRVLIHEWAHVQRRDDLFNVLQVLVRLIGGWHPALWWIERRLHVEREIACDEVTVAFTGAPKSYAECLMKLCSLRGISRAMQSAPAIFTPSSLRARVVQIVSPHPPIATGWSRALAAAIVLVLCMLSVAVGGMSLVQASAFAEPVLSAGTIARLPMERLVPAAASAPADAKAASSPRRTPTRATSPERPAAGQAGSSQSPIQPAAPGSREPGPAPAPAPTPAIEAVPQPAPLTALEGTAVPLTPPAAPNATPESSRSPWSAAAAGGAAIGRTSKDAGVATAGFFTRVARRVAGSF